MVVDGNTGSSNNPSIGDISAFEQSIHWLRKERHYTLQKFGTEQDRQHVRDFAEAEYGHATWFNQQFDTYYHRAWVLGLETHNGRQALAKFVSTAAGMLSAAIQEYGVLPEAGVPSGEIK